MSFTYPAPDGAPAASFALCDVRLLITDTDTANAIFQDSDIATFLRIENNVVKLAAAQALDFIASRTNLVQKKIETLGLKTDGPTMAKDLREHANRLREQAAREGDSDIIDEDGLFGFAEMHQDDFSAREHVRNSYLRGL